jgi:hypothetical protein
MTSRRAARRKALEQGQPRTAGKATCEVCGRKTRQLFGVCAEVTNQSLGTSAVMVAALGYCSDHREGVPARYQRELESQGEVTLADSMADLVPPTWNSSCSSATGSSPKNDRSCWLTANPTLRRPAVVGHRAPRG